MGHQAGRSRVAPHQRQLRPERFAAIRRRGDLAVVPDAMDVAEAAALLPLKVNVVLLRDQNDDEILDFAGFARRTGRVVRVIELTPLECHFCRLAAVSGHTEPRSGRAIPVRPRDR